MGSTHEVVDIILISLVSVVWVFLIFVSVKVIRLLGCKDKLLMILLFFLNATVVFRILALVIGLVNVYKKVTTSNFCIFASFQDVG